MLINLCPLADVRPEEVEQLLDAAFGTDRQARTAYRIRAGMLPIPELSLAAYEEERLVGTLQSWPIALHGPAGETPLILVGPVAVDPDRQQRGIGRTMMTAMLSRTEGCEPLVLIGDPEYYGRLFGFIADATANWELPGPFERRRLLARTGGRDLPYRGMLGPRQSPRQDETRGLDIR
ncbi:MAG TPA: N-acetyltransferase [Sphingomonas sp.]|nr:N-acetyltransferase [Sphingomonas sp.]